MKSKFSDMAMFKLLLKEVTAVFLKENDGVSANIKDWKGQDIGLFQEDLRDKVNASISEKWFYTYIKNTPKKLPRIDILNLLSEYAGHKNWNSFSKKYREGNQNTKGKSRLPVLLGVCLVFVVITIYAFLPRENALHFCFVDADKKEAITDIVIDIIVLNDKESPTYAKTDSLGCIDLVTKEDYIKFVAQSPYHKNDTIYRSISNDVNQQQVRLRTDDYALMLHYYGGNNVKDWKKRKAELQKLIADKALIFELLPHQLGVEIYNKSDFISKLTTPTSSLQKLEVVQTEYDNGQIVKLKFRINEK